MAKAKATEMTRLVNSGWKKEMEAGLRADKSGLRIICPFITARALNQLLALDPDKIQVITRFNLNDFSLGVSDIEALAALLDAGAEVRGVQGLHAKLYLFGNSRVIVTSANLTTWGLTRNHEFGLVTEDERLIATCQTHFVDLWRRAGENLEREKLNVWTGRVGCHRKARKNKDNPEKLEDYGTDLRNTSSSLAGALTGTTNTPQAFVKFFGISAEAIDPATTVIEQIKEIGCYWAAMYRPNKRVNRVQDDAVIFIGRFTKKPKDLRIFGRAFAIRYDGDRDDATPAEKKRWSHTKKWSRYIRVRDAEFIKGTLGDGVSMNELKESLWSLSFASTKHHAEIGHGNTNPNRAYIAQPDVELSPEGFDWLNESLEAAFKKHGKGKIIPKKDSDQFWWPDIKGVGKWVIR